MPDFKFSNEPAKNGMNSIISRLGWRKITIKPKKRAAKTKWFIFLFSKNDLIK
jgi:hypothetical protein